MCFAPRPPEPQNIGKNKCFATFKPFRAPSYSLSLSLSISLSLSLLWSSFFFPSLLWLFPPLLFPSVHIILSEVWLLNFLHLCGEHVGNMASSKASHIHIYNTRYRETGFRHLLVKAISHTIRVEKKTYCHFLKTSRKRRGSWTLPLRGVYCV